MVISSTENLAKFFQNIRSIGIFGRIFSWNRILQQASAAVVEIKILINEINELSQKFLDSQSMIQSLQKDIDYLKKSNADITKELALKNQEYQKLISDKIEKERELAAFKESEISRQQQYEHKITELNSLKQQIDDDRRRIQKEREQEIENHYNQMKELWKDHEKQVELILRNICTRHQIEYIDKEKVPFRGKPDNSIKICDEYIIFDAKSPASDDLDNFPLYLKNQAESVKKYIKENNVHKQIFLVIPSNTLHKINQFFYNMAEYDVFIITIDSLEPILLALKKIEDYEFAEQLSPEERDNICRIIGKFAHATKRRMQIDSYFCSEFINILNNCYSLPEDIKKKTVEFEKADKMNPPLEKRAKEISIQKLEKEITRNKKEIEAHEIESKISPEIIRSIPLYKDENVSS